MGVGFGDECGCERRIEVFVKIQKNMGGGGSCGGLEVRLDVNGEVKFFVIFFFFFFFWGGEGRVG